MNQYDGEEPIHEYKPGLGAICPMCRKPEGMVMAFIEWDAPGNSSGSDAEIMKCAFCGEEWAE